MTFKCQDGRELPEYYEDQKELKPGLYLALFHGREAPEQALSDWGFNGPVIGPLRYAHMTYCCDLKISLSREGYERYFPEEAAKERAAGLTVCEPVDHSLAVVKDLVVYDGRYFGDFTVFYHQG